MRGRARASAAVSPTPQSDQLDTWRQVEPYVTECEDSYGQRDKLSQTIADIIDKYPTLLKNLSSHVKEEDSQVREGVAELDDLDKAEVAVQKLKALFQQELQLWEQQQGSLQEALESVLLLISLKAEPPTPQSDASGPIKKRRRLDDEPRGSKRGKASADLPVVGSQVAFRVRRLKGGDEEWIQCVVLKVLAEGSKYEIQDPEPDENGNPGQSYKASIKDMILISERDTGLPNFSPGTIVLARYPETTSFYRAEVNGTRRDGKVRLKFEGEEEEDKETEIERRFVLSLPQ